MKTWNQFVNEKSNLSFSYKNNDLPTDDMIEWVQDNYWVDNFDTMDELEKDEHTSSTEKNFFEYFHDELMDLSYMEMVDIFNKCKL